MTAAQSYSSPAEMVDLFAGPGGLDVAARWLGVSVTGIEWDANACETRKEALLDTRKGDVRHYGPTNFPNAKFLAGGPPCQTYTVAGNGAGRRALDRVLEFVKRMGAGEDVRTTLSELDDDRTGLVLEPLRWALEAYELKRPFEAIVLEQVPAVLPVWQAMKEPLEAIGYHVDCGILRTEQYGVPQTGAGQSSSRIEVRRCPSLSRRIVRTASQLRRRRPTTACCRGRQWVAHLRRRVSIHLWLSRITALAETPRRGEGGCHRSLGYRDREGVPQPPGGTRWLRTGATEPQGSGQVADLSAGLPVVGQRYFAADRQCHSSPPGRPCSGSSARAKS